MEEMVHYLFQSQRLQRVLHWRLCPLDNLPSMARKHRGRDQCLLHLEQRERLLGKIELEHFELVSTAQKDIMPQSGTKKMQDVQHYQATPCLFCPNAHPVPMAVEHWTKKSRLAIHQAMPLRLQREIS